jgi:hypothetical protein
VINELLQGQVNPDGNIVAANLKADHSRGILLAPVVLYSPRAMARVRLNLEILVSHLRVVHKVVKYAND